MNAFITSVFEFYCLQWFSPKIAECVRNHNHITGFLQTAAYSYRLFNFARSAVIIPD